MENLGQRVSAINSVHLTAKIMQYLGQTIAIFKVLEIVKPTAHWKFLAKVVHRHTRKLKHESKKVKVKSDVVLWAILW